MKRADLAASKDAAPRFTPHQRQELRTLGLDAAQISRLERVLYTVAPLFEPPPPMRDVRDQLFELKKHIDAAVSQLEAMQLRSRVLPAAKEALDLLSKAATHCVTPEVQPLDQLRALQALVRQAEESLPNKQRVRARSASGSPVALIYAALVEGWEARFGLARTGASFGKCPPAMPFVPSRSPDSQFRRIVEICFGALQGEYEASAEAAIRTYLRQTKNGTESG